MMPPKNPDQPSRPVMVVIAGLHGAGKTTLLEQLLGEEGFPSQMVADTPGGMEALDAAMLEAVALKKSIAVETSFDHSGVVEWMIKAAERDFSVELIIVGVDNDQLLLDRLSRRQDKRRILEAVRRMSSAVDNARRVLLVDNTTGIPFTAASIDSGELTIIDSRPAWVAERIAGPRLARAASLKAIRGLYQAMASKAPVAPVLQASGFGATVYAGRIVGLSEHHVLQQIGDALHVIHDIALLSTGGTGLALNAIATLMYSLPERVAPQNATEVSKEHAQER